MGTKPCEDPGLGGCIGGKRLRTGRDLSRMYRNSGVASYPELTLPLHHAGVQPLSTICSWTAGHGQSPLGTRS